MLLDAVLLAPGTPGGPAGDDEGGTTDDQPGGTEAADEPMFARWLREHHAVIGESHQFADTGIVETRKAVNGVSAVR